MKDPLKARTAHSAELRSPLTGAGPDFRVRSRTMDQLLATVRRVESSRNPFGVPVFDCRDFATSVLANAAEPIPQETTILPPPERDTLPDGVVSLNCSLTYPLGEVPPEGLLFTARTMQDKWHIYHDDGRLIFTRSWTGDPLFMAEFDAAPPVVTVRKVHAYPGAFDGGPTLAVGIVDFLIKSHLFRVSVPHPLPEELPEIPSLVATWSFNHFGRWGHYATWVDVTRLQLASLDGGLVLRWLA